MGSVGELFEAGSVSSAKYSGNSDAQSPGLELVFDGKLDYCRRSLDYAVPQARGVSTVGRAQCGRHCWVTTKNSRAWRSICTRGVYRTHRLFVRVRPGDASPFRSASDRRPEERARRGIQTTIGITTNNRIRRRSSRKRWDLT